MDMDTKFSYNDRHSKLDLEPIYLSSCPLDLDDQIEYDSEVNPVGVSGAQTPFPPFHWKCRTGTEILF